MISIFLPLIFLPFFIRLSVLPFSGWMLSLTWTGKSEILHESKAIFETGEDCVFALRWRKIKGGRWEMKSVASQLSDRFSLGMDSFWSKDRIRREIQTSYSTSEHKTSLSVIDNVFWLLYSQSIFYSICLPDRSQWEELEQGNLVHWDEVHSSSDFRCLQSLIHLGERRERIIPSLSFSVHFTTGHRTCKTIKYCT